MWNANCKATSYKQWLAYKMGQGGIAGGGWAFPYRIDYQPSCLYPIHIIHGHRTLSTPPPAPIPSLPSPTTRQKHIWASVCARPMLYPFPLPSPWSLLERTTKWQFVRCLCLPWPPSWTLNHHSFQVALLSSNMWWTYLQGRRRERLGSEERFLPRLSKCLWSTKLTF